MSLAVCDRRRCRSARTRRHVVGALRRDRPHHHGISTLLPILGGAGVLPLPARHAHLAGGAVGELGPIVAISVALTTDSPGRTAVVRSPCSPC
ncbi:MAG: hypothetical protein R2713_10615 [Ilumatobacteraceae bacterium]